MSRIIIDVREPAEFATGHVPGALNIPPAKLMAGAKDLAEIPKDAELVVYCRTGHRSAVSAHILHTLGYTKVINGINQDHVMAQFFGNK